MPQRTDVRIQKAAPEHLAGILALYRANRLARVDAASRERFRRYGGLIRLPSRRQLRDMILDDRFTVGVALERGEVCGAVWGAYDLFSVTEMSGVSPADCATAAFRAAGVRPGATGYGGDILVRPGLQGSPLGYLLYRSFMRALRSKGKANFVLTIEGIASVRTAGRTLAANARNQPTLNMHRKLGSVVLKVFRDEVPVSARTTIGRRCEHHLLDLRDSLSVISRRLAAFDAAERRRAGARRGGTRAR